MANDTVVGNKDMSEDNSGVDVIEQDDGSAIVNFDESSGNVSPDESSFYQNLAEVLSNHELSSISLELCDLIDSDKQSREKRDKQYEEGLRRTGLGDDAPGGAEFEGASKVVHPALAEACVDYAAAAIKETFPSDGPVKMHVLSQSIDPNEIERSENKRDFFNWQLTEQITEYKSELEVLFTQQPLGGSQYLKIWFDVSKNRIRVEFVPIDKVYLPFDASSFSTAQRITISDTISSYEYRRRVESGLYRDIEIPSDSGDFEESASQLANDKIEGKTNPSDPEVGPKHLYEVYAYYDIEGDGELPYVITIDAISKEIVSIYRNWKEEDNTRQKLDWLVEFPFIPWRGAYGIGLIHLIGGLAASATGALRSLLDSAHINTLPGGLKLKGARSSGTTMSISATEVHEIDAPPNIDDIRKVFMGWPFNPPSPVLFQLLGWLTDAAKGVVTTAEEKISEANNQMPVGTALALIEQGSKVFATIHARQHDAQKRVLKILHRLNGDFFDAAAQEKAFGRVIVPQEEFLNPANVVPVSDPSIFSESQRYAQTQAILQMSQDGTVQWNKHAIYTRMLRLMHVESPQEFLPPVPQPVSADPISEIEAAMSGQQLKALPDMPHMLHIQEQLDFLLNPVFGAASPVIVNAGFQVILTDTFQHIVFLFKQLKQQAQQQAQQQVQQSFLLQIQNMVLSSGVPPELAQQQIQSMSQNPQIQQQMMSQVQQQASIIFAKMSQLLAPIVQKLQQADQLVKQKTPPPPMPPEVQAQIQIAQMEIQRKTQADQASLQLKQQESQVDQQLEQIRLQMESQQQQFDQSLAAQSLQLESMAAQLAQQVEIQKNNDDNRQHQMTELMKNHEDNQTNLMMEQMRQEGLTQRNEMKEAFESQQKKLDMILNSIIKEEELRIKEKAVSQKQSEKD